MTFLVYDTETTGFPRRSLPLDHENQPYIVQLAAQLCEDDGSVICGINLIIDNGVDIPKEASDIHGITEDKAGQLGVSPAVAFYIFTTLAQRTTLMVAHHIRFDDTMMDIALARTCPGKKLSAKRHCTMEQAAPIVNLPPTAKMLKAGFNKPKPPKLEECIKHFFGEELKGAHDAMIDVEACKRIYLHMRDME